MRQPAERRCSTCLTGTPQSFTLTDTCTPRWASRSAAALQQCSLPPQGTYSFAAINAIFDMAFSLRLREFRASASEASVEELPARRESRAAMYGGLSLLRPAK